MIIYFKEEKYMNLGQLLHELERSFNEMLTETKDYLHNPVIKDFVSQKESDYITFRELVSKYDKQLGVPNIIKKLQKRNTESKFYGGMCIRRSKYFDYNKEVKDELENEMFRTAFKKETSEDIHFDADYAIPDELDRETFDKLYGEEVAG